MDELDRKLLSLFAGKVVRKDLVGPLKGHLNVPTYVLEYLLGKYCSSEDATVIDAGLVEVRRILSENFVHPDQAEVFKARVKERGRHRVIDKVKARLSETEDRYWAELVNLQLTNVNIDEELVNRYEKMLAGGIWAIVEISYNPELFHKGQLRPFVIETLRPIQIAITNLNEILERRAQFTCDEWIDVLLRSIGFEPAGMDLRLKLLLLCRLIPLVENNYNFVELGPRGTGKSYAYRELSPYAILVSGGETTIPNLFVSHAGRGRIGLVGLWDCVAFDEVAGLRKLSSPAAVKILQDYMETGSFSRGREEINALASLVFIGNIDVNVDDILRAAHLFVPFPEEMQDPAFLDRFHSYLPGWEVPKMRPTLFTSHYGFVIDYLAEFFRAFRKTTQTRAFDAYFKLGTQLNQRDQRAVRKTVSGLLKLIHPDGRFTKEEIEEYLAIALEARRRVKEQIKKMRPVEYWETRFTYLDLEASREFEVTTPEQARREPPQIPHEPRIGEVIGLSVAGSYGMVQLFEVSVSEGSGRLIPLGSMMKIMKESLRAAYEYVSAHHDDLGIDSRFKEDYDISVLATQMALPKEGPSAGITVLVGLVSALTKKPVRNDVAMTGEITLHGKILGVGGIQEKLLAAKEAGLRRVYVPAENKGDVDTLPDEIRDALHIQFVSRVDEVLNAAIIGYQTPTAQG